MLTFGENIVLCVYRLILLSPDSFSKQRRRDAHRTCWIYPNPGKSKIFFKSSFLFPVGTPLGTISNSLQTNKNPLSGTFDFDCSNLLWEPFTATHESIIFECRESQSKCPGVLDEFRTFPWQIKTLYCYRVVSFGFQLWLCLTRATCFVFQDEREYTQCHSGVKRFLYFLSESLVERATDYFCHLATSCWVIHIFPGETLRHSERAVEH